jgi:hypothetical protein
MNEFSEEAESYWNGEHVRYLADNNKVPSVEDRVKAAFDAGVNSIFQGNFEIYANKDINFPKGHEL